MLRNMGKRQGMLCEKKVGISDIMYCFFYIHSKSEFVCFGIDT